MLVFVGSVPGFLYLFHFLSRRRPALAFGLGAGLRGGGRSTAFAVMQCRDGAAHRQAFATGIFEQIGLPIHRHLAAANAFATSGQFAAEAVVRVGARAGAASGVARRRYQVEAFRTGASAIGHGAAIADDGGLRWPDRADIGDASSARGINVCARWADTLTRNIGRAVEANDRRGRRGRQRRRCQWWDRRCRRLRRLRQGGRRRLRRF